jgi:hypothetical protein
MARFAHMFGALISKTFEMEIPKTVSSPVGGSLHSLLGELHH